LLPNVQVPFGLRTVDGTFNHLRLGQSEFGSADTVFPHLTDSVFRNDLDVDTFDVHGPAPGGMVTNTNYAGPGDVANTDPRIIRNLIVDQLPFNPATGEGNPAAAAEATPPGSEVVLSPSLDDDFGITSNNTILFIPNVTWDVSLSTSFNAWFTFFGQFFDHGLDLAAKGGSDTVCIPLKAVDLTAGIASGFTSMARIENIVGGAGSDTLNGGAGNHVFVFVPLSFDSTINGFDANPAGGGQDLLNISTLGITAVTFTTSGNITPEGTEMMID